MISILDSVNAQTFLSFIFDNIHLQIKNHILKIAFNTTTSTHQKCLGSMLYIACIFYNVAVDLESFEVNMCLITIRKRSSVHCTPTPNQIFYKPVSCFNAKCRKQFLHNRRSIWMRLSGHRKVIGHHNSGKTLGRRHAQLYIQHCVCRWPSTVRTRTSPNKVMTKLKC